MPGPSMPILVVALVWLVKDVEPRQLPTLVALGQRILEEFANGCLV